MEVSPASLPIDEIIVGKRARLDLGDVADFARKIEARGLIHPIVIRPDGRLVAGHRRLEAFRLLGRTEVPVTIKDGSDDELVLDEVAENVDRKDFKPSEIEGIRLRHEAAERAAAKARQREHGGTAPSKHSGKVSTSERTRDRIGAFAGVSGRTVEKIAAIVAAAEAEPEKYAKLAADMDRTGRVDGPFKRLRVARQAEAIRKEPPPLPDKGPYRGIVIDPPWPFEMRMEDPSHRAIYPYSTMTLAQISATPVRALAHDHCVLWLWTTNYNMEEAFGLVRAWGFERKTILTWVKDRFGYGDWLRTQTEHCIMATRGRPVVQLTNESTALFAPMRGHSQKPPEFYDLVEKLCPAPGYLDMFSRYRHSSLWTCWGAEAPAEERSAAE